MQSIIGVQRAFLAYNIQYESGSGAGASLMTAPVALVITNYNSGKYIMLSSLSLVSAFKLNYDNYKVFLIDSHSTDESFQELVKIGVELSRISGVSFEYVRLPRDLGNTFAIYYAWRKARRQGFRYIALLDNDYIITNTSILTKIVNIFEYLNSNGRKVYGIAPIPLWCRRTACINAIAEVVRTRYPAQMLARIVFDKYASIVNDIIKQIYNFKLYDYANMLDIYGNIVQLKIEVTEESINNINDIILSVLGLGKRAVDGKLMLIPTAYVCSCFAVYPTEMAAFYPLNYIYYDDICAGIACTMHGIKSYYLIEVGGIHCSLKERRTALTTYLKYRNTAMCNLSLFGKRVLPNIIMLAIYNAIKKIIKEEIKEFFLEFKYAVRGIYDALRLNRSVQIPISRWFRIPSFHCFEGSRKYNLNFLNLISPIQICKFEDSVFRKLLIYFLSADFATNKAKLKYMRSMGSALYFESVAER